VLHPDSNPMASGVDLDMVALQDELMIATTDLDRLRALLDHAVERLIAQFSIASEETQRLKLQDLDTANRIAAALASAQVALQFQDLSTQLVTHVMTRMHSVADALAIRALPDEEVNEVLPHFVARPCPVAQREMDAGTVELF
jgi:predicted RecB family endonuclease